MCIWILELGNKCFLCWTTSGTSLSYSSDVFFEECAFTGMHLEDSYQDCAGTLNCKYAEWLNELGMFTCKCGWGDMAICLEINERLPCGKKGILCLGISKGQN